MTVEVWMIYSTISLLTLIVCATGGLVVIGVRVSKPTLHTANPMARPQGLFLILEIPDIQAIVAKAVELLKQGKTMMEYADSGTSVTKQFPMTVQETLLEARYALMVKDPETYGAPDRVRVINMLNNFRGF